MDYVPGQRPAELRMDRRRVLLILSALRDYGPTLMKQHPARLRVMRAFAQALPSSLPYIVRVYSTEWQVLSPALRAANTKAHAALYHWLSKRCQFVTVQGEERNRRKMKQHHLSRLRGVYDRERDPGAPRIPARGRK